MFRHLAVLAVVVSLGYLVTMAVAQNPAGGRPAQVAAGSRLALLDVSRIFKEHAGFKQQMELMKADVQAAEGQVRAKREALLKLNEQLQALQRGTPDYTRTDEALNAQQTELALSIQRSKAKFLQREAEIYYGVYRDIYSATDYFCKQHSIDMVFRFSSEEADVQRPDSVLAWINKPVVWYDPGLDITGAILQEVNRAPVSANRNAPSGPASPFGAR